MADISVLLEGYKRFHLRYFKSDDPLYRDSLSRGQSPKTLIVACSDSRVDPSIVTDAKPGDIFVIRNVANLVPPYDPDTVGLHGVSAALEFGVKFLQVENIVVMGHSGCAGVQTLVDGDDQSSIAQQSHFIKKWVSISYEAKAKAKKNYHNPEDVQQCCEKESIKISLANLKTFPWIKESVTKGALKLHGWYFSIEDGSLVQFQENEDIFIDI